jgi:hypothetical protein
MVICRSHSAADLYPQIRVPWLSTVMGTEGVAPAGYIGLHVVRPKLWSVATKDEEMENGK